MYGSKILVCTIAAALLCGCVKISDEYVEYIPYTDSVYTETETITETYGITEITEDTVCDTDSTETAETVSESLSVRSPDTPPEKWDPSFFDNCLFIGDSVCRALSVYGDLIDPERVAAAGGCAARNIHEFTFKLNDIDYTVNAAVAEFQADYVYLWMGINDINLSTKEEYAENMLDIARDISYVSPESRIVIIGMTPTASYHDWGANPRILEYNEALREMTERAEIPIRYIDVTDVLSDENGFLTEECDGGDGMHLAQRAYYRVLSKIYRTLTEDSEAVVSETESVTVDIQIPDDFLDGLI